MLWDRDRLLLALSTRSLNLTLKPQSHGGLLYKSYTDFYGLNFIGTGHASRQFIEVVPSTDFDLVVQVFEPDARLELRSQVLLVHGYFDHVGLYKHVIKLLLAQGVRVVAFDLPGHGLSSGKRASIRSFGQYQVALRSVLSSKHITDLPLYLLGQSTGGAIIADALSANAVAAESLGGGSDNMHRALSGVTLGGAIMLAPLLRPLAWSKAEFMHSLLKGRKAYWPRSYKDNSHDSGFLRFLRQDPLQHDGLSVDWVGALRKWVPDILGRNKQVTAGIENLTIIQGTQDTTVDWKFNLSNYRQIFPLARVVSIKNAGHHLVCESKDYRDKVFAAITSALK